MKAKGIVRQQLQNGSQLQSFVAAALVKSCRTSSILGPQHLRKGAAGSSKSSRPFCLSFSLFSLVLVPSFVVSELLSLPLSQTCQAEAPNLVLDAG